MSLLEGNISTGSFAEKLKAGNAYMELERVKRDIGKFATGFDLSLINDQLLKIALNGLRLAALSGATATTTSQTSAPSAAGKSGSPKLTRVSTGGKAKRVKLQYQWASYLCCWWYRRSERCR